MLGKTVQENQRMAHVIAHVGDVKRGAASAHVPMGPGALKLDRAGGNEGCHLRASSFSARLRARLEYRAPAGFTDSIETRRASSARPVRRAE